MTPEPQQKQNMRASDRPNMRDQILASRRSAEAIERWKRRKSRQTKFMIALTALTLLSGFGILLAGHMPSRLSVAMARDAGLRLDFLGAAAIMLAVGLLMVVAIRFSALHQEIDKWRRAHAKAQAQATRDSLTGLPNRRRLKAELALALARVRRGRPPVGLLVLNLDDFRKVNQFHGARVADLLLRDVAQRIKQTVRETDIVAHLAADQFAILAEIRNGDDSSRLAERLMTELHLPFDLGVATVTTTCHIGIAVAPDDANSPDMLLQHAESALHRTDDGATSAIRFFEHSMDERMRRRAALEVAVGAAIANDQISLHYQPLVDLDTRRICGFEALARWWQPPRGLIPPSEFFAAAEAIGLLGQLTDNLLRQACRAGANWPAELIVSVNIAPSQFLDRSLPGRIKDILHETGLQPDRLEIEIAETALASDLEESKTIAQAVRNLGVRLALDNFGTGYAGLRYLQAIRFDKIKLDAALVRSMAEDTEGSRIMEAMLALCQSLRIPTVAEGVETEAEAVALTELGCTVGQGWWFGRPIPPEGVNAIFARV